MVELVKNSGSTVSMITIILIDDHKIVRQGIRKILDSESDLKVVGEAGDGLQALKLIKELHPDIIITDLMMKGMSGFDLIRQTTQTSPEAKSLVLSMYDDEIWVMGALEAGARGYVLKESGASDLVQAIHSVLSGKYFLSPPLSMEKVEEYRCGIRKKPEK